MNDSKQHILDVALKLFLQKGFKEVTMRDIVEQTGLSKGAVYYYFESKEVLFLEIVQNTFSSQLLSVFENYENKSLYEFYHDYVNITVQRQIRHFTDNKISAEGDLTENHIAMMFDALKINPEFKNRIKANRRREIKTWTEVVKNARKNGEIISTMSDVQIVMIFIYSGMGIGLEVITNNNMNNLANEYLKFWDSFYESIKV